MTTDPFSISLLATAFFAAFLGTLAAGLGVTALQAYRAKKQLAEPQKQ